MPTEIKGTATDSQSSCDLRCDVCGFRHDDCRLSIGNASLFLPLHVKYHDQKLKLGKCMSIFRVQKILLVIFLATLLTLSFLNITPSFGLLINH